MYISLVANVPDEFISLTACRLELRRSLTVITMSLHVTMVSVSINRACVGNSIGFSDRYHFLPWINVGSKCTKEYNKVEEWSNEIK